MIIVERKPIVSTTPWSWPGTSILSPGWNLFSPIIKIPEIRFLKKSWAPRATATENKPNPATSGPIWIPKSSRIIAIPIIQTITLEDLSSHICIDSVSQEVDDIAVKIGCIEFANAEKIVKTIKALTILEDISPATPSRGKIMVIMYIPMVIGT